MERGVQIVWYSIDRLEWNHLPFIRLFTSRSLWNVRLWPCSWKAPSEGAGLEQNGNINHIMEMYWKYWVTNVLTLSWHFGWPTVGGTVNVRERYYPIYRCTQVRLPVGYWLKSLQKTQRGDPVAPSGASIATRVISAILTGRSHRQKNIIWKHVLPSVQVTFTIRQYCPVLSNWQIPGR